MSFSITGQHNGPASISIGVAGRLLVLAGAMHFVASGASAWADTSERPTIVSAVQIWELPQAQKQLAHPLRIEGRVSFFDPIWKALWIEQDGVGSYILVGETPPALQQGQRVLIEGSLVPAKGLSGDSVKVTVLRENEPVTPLETAGRISDVLTLRGRVVTADGYVTAQQYVDDEHVRLALIVDNRPVIGWFKPDNPRAIPNWAGKFIRLQALYSPRFTPTNTETTIELWAGPEHNVMVLGSLADSPLFDLPRTAINQLYTQPLGTRVLVRGSVEGHDAGSFMVIRDDTGQVAARSIQPDRIPFGTEVEAIGQVGVDGAKWVLQQSFYRKAKPRESVAPGLGRAEPLDSVERIRQLSLEQAATRLPVKISGLVTWSMLATEFFFLQDVSGGIRVRYDLRTMETPQLGKYLDIEGVTVDGGFMPAVELRSVVDRGSMSPPEGRPVTFEQAITGKEDGQWVVMRGFIQRTESDGDWRWIYVTTSGGDFVGHLQSPVNFVANPGSLIRVHGVCEATADRAGQLTGVMLRVPFIHSIVIEDDAPLDYFDLPVRSIKGLRRLSGARDLTRVRISGTVLHSIPGRALYIQDGDAALQLLSRQQLALAPGARIDAVGILGWEGTRIVLRETVYRQIGYGVAPSPVRILDPSRMVPALDAHLVSVSGTLIDVAQQADHTRLNLQSGGMLFEATLPREPGARFEPPVGAGLQLTGLYQLGLDESRQARRFTLQLRTPADLAVVRSPRLWTVKRALIVAGLLAGFSLLGIAWITALRRRMHQQTRQIREQLERQSRLEAEVHRAARLESLGVLAGGIAHDFNNLLTIIIGNLGLVLLDKNLSDDARHSLGEIERGTTRARTLTRQLLTFAKGGDPLRTPVQLPGLVKDTVDRALHGSLVRCEYSVAGVVNPVFADKDQIAQALQNLVLNAIQAMPRGGLLRVSLHNEMIPAGDRKNLAPGNYVKLMLSDSGEGIPEAVLPRIFDPYFSTRKTGSGLGLATVYSIVKRHEGWIEVESKVGEGATFTLWLPTADPESAATLIAVTEQDEAFAPEPVAASPAAAPTRPAARILLMDDETSIQRVVTFVLQRMGLEVTAVSDGAAALREFTVAQHEGRPFDLLLLDLTVPGAMGGREVMELIRKLDTAVPAIVSSGYSNDPVMANFKAHGFQAVVQKPYDVSQLAAVVNRLLEERT